MDRVQHAVEQGGQSLDLSDYGEYLRNHIHVHETIFGDERPFPQCHAASLAQLRNNRMLVVWFGGTHEKHDDVGIWSACRHQTRWSPPRLVAKVADVPHWNPVLSAPSDGPVHLFFEVGREIASWETWHAVSTDEGETWSDPRPLVPGDRGGRSWSPIRPTELPNNNSGLDLARLHDGTLALVCNPVGGTQALVYDPVDGAARTPLSILLSSDNGQTWPRRLDIETGSGEYSYPAIIPVPMGMAVVYTWKRERIGFWLGSVERIPAVE